METTEVAVPETLEFLTKLSTCHWNVADFTSLLFVLVQQHFIDYIDLHEESKAEDTFECTLDEE